MQRLNTPRAITREMIWCYRRSSELYPGAKHFVLTFADNPAHSVVIYSNELGPYLEYLPGKRVAVTFEVEIGFTP